MTYKNNRLKHVKVIKALCSDMKQAGVSERFISEIKDQCNLLLETKKKKSYVCIRCEQIFSKHSQLGLHLDKQGNVCYKGIAGAKSVSATKKDPKEQLEDIEKLGDVPPKGAVVELVSGFTELSQIVRENRDKLNQVIDRLNILSKSK